MDFYTIVAIFCGFLVLVFLLNIGSNVFYCTRCGLGRKEKLKDKACSNCGYVEIRELD